MTSTHIFFLLQGSFIAHSSRWIWRCELLQFTERAMKVSHSTDFLFIFHEHIDSDVFTTQWKQTKHINTTKNNTTFQRIYCFPNVRLIWFVRFLLLQVSGIDNSCVERPAVSVTLRNRLFGASPAHNVRCHRLPWDVSCVGSHADICVTGQGEVKAVTVVVTQLLQLQMGDMTYLYLHFF